MNRIALYICMVLALLSISAQTGYAQVPREVPGPDLANPNSIRPPSDQRFRIPDSFFRHDNLPVIVRQKEIVPLSVIRKEVLSKYPGRIVDVQLLVPKREGINYLYDVRVLTEAGKLLSVKIDAKSAKIVDVRG